VSPKKESRPEVNALLAFALSLLVLFAFNHFYKPAIPPPASKQATAHQQGIQQAPSLPVTSPIVAAAEAAPAAPDTAVQASDEKTIVVQSPLYRVILSNRGAVAKSWQLSKYSDDKKPPHPLDLVSVEGSQQVGAWPLSLILPDAASEDKSASALYRMTPSEPTVTAPVEISFEWSDGHLAVRKDLKFGADYVVNLVVSVTLDGKPLPVGVAWRGGFGDPDVYKASQLVTVFYDINGKLTLLPYKKLGVPNQQQTPAQQSGAMSFTGIEDQFFTAAFLADNSGLALWHWTEERNVKEGDTTSQQPIAEMAAGTASAEPLHTRLFVGPKDITLLNRQNPPLGDLVNFGYISFLAKPLLEVLKWIHHFVPNYGWAIVVLTLVINMALFPLKVKSWRSMQKMQRVKPQMDSIQAKYKKFAMNDPRKKKMNEEMMELYKREGVNPVGGCLPMLLQFPVWAALYRTLGGAIELRHAPWILWVHDLSAYDHTYILPVLMTVTMYVTQKMTPQQAAVDPMQQKMFAFMPLIFGFMFFHSSSGLVLYILTSNLVSMAQQYFLNRTEPLPAGPSRMQKMKRLATSK
jgi:YidC/Oxa1 family membrane protein insertase